MIIRRKCLVKGLVQGVGFRHYVAQRASSLGLSGYARNVAGGQVEVEVQGEDTDVNQLVGALHLGPPDAIVQDVQILEIDTMGAGGGFEIR